PGRGETADEARRDRRGQATGGRPLGSAGAALRRGLRPQHPHARRARPLGPFKLMVAGATLGVAQFAFLYTLTASGTQVFNTNNARAFGPEALATNGEFAPAGTTWNDSRYATVIAGAGKQYGLVIDLGKAAGRGITRVQIQADA